MNARKAKQLRRTAERFMRHFIVKKVLDPEQLEGISKKEMINVLPKVMYTGTYQKKVAVGTQRWFIKKTKAGDITAMKEAIY